MMFWICAALINPTEVQVGFPDCWGDLEGVEFYNFINPSEAERFIGMVNAERFNYNAREEFHEFITALEFEEEFIFV